jgi:hypothetical protein
VPAISVTRGVMVRSGFAHLLRRIDGPSSTWLAEDQTPLIAGSFIASLIVKTLTPAARQVRVSGPRSPGAEADDH